MKKLGNKRHCGAAAGLLLLLQKLIDKKAVQYH
jgi:hypothetical protein